MTVYIRIQLLEKIARVFCPEATKMLILQEEVHAEVFLTDYCGVLDSEVADTREDQVLESFQANYTRARVYE
jgi:hypothetical protein